MSCLALLSGFSEWEEEAHWHRNRGDNETVGPPTLRCYGNTMVIMSKPGITIAVSTGARKLLLSWPPLDLSF